MQLGNIKITHGSCMMLPSDNWLLQTLEMGSHSAFPMDQLLQPCTSPATLLTLHELTPFVWQIMRTRKHNMVPKNFYPFVIDSIKATAHRRKATKNMKSALDNPEPAYTFLHNEL